MNLSRRACWTAALAAVTLGVGLLSAPALAKPDASSDRAAVAACVSSDMAISYHGRGAGMGHRYGVIAIKNTSDHACRTGGYGGVSYVGDGNGTQIGAPADRDPGHVRSFVVQPGQRLVSPIQETVAQNFPRKRCHPAHVDGFRVYLPNETHSQYVKHPTTGCRKHKVHLLSHKPYRRPAH